MKGDLDGMNELIFFSENLNVGTVLREESSPPLAPSALHESLSLARKTNSTP